MDRSRYLNRTPDTKILTPPRRHVPISPPLCFHTFTTFFSRNSHGMTITRKTTHGVGIPKRSPHEAPFPIFQAPAGDTLTPLESNHCAIWRANSHRIKSWHKNTRGGGGPHTANALTPADFSETRRASSGQIFSSDR